MEAANKNRYGAFVFEVTRFATVDKNQSSTYKL